MGLREYAAAQRAEDNAGDAGQQSSTPAPFYYRGIYNAVIAFHEKHAARPDLMKNGGKRLRNCPKWQRQ